MRRVEWSAPAEWDLQAIDDYWCTHSARRADIILDLVRASGDFLAAFPKAGPAVDENGIRKWRVSGTDYILIYRLIPEAVQIVRVRHTREDWRAG